METGKLLRFDENRGFGFIAPDKGGPDLFMHVGDLQDSQDQYALVPGRTWLEYGRGTSPKGPKAIRIAIADAPGEAPEAATGEQGEAWQEEPVMPTEEAWQELWDAGFKAIMEKARANGWVS